MMAKGRNLLAMALLMGAAVLSIPGCSDDPSGTGTDATVAMKGELEAASVSATRQKDDATVTLSAPGAEVDSLKVSRVRILVSEIKLHRSNEDTVAGDKTVKTAPVLITIDSAGSRTFTTATIPAGSYDKVKFEFHRFASSETAQYLNDTNYRDFVTNDRWTFIVDGMVYNDGVAAPFTYRSDVTANLSLKFEPSIALAEGSSTSIVLVVDPVAVFMSGSKVLDPRDGQNESEIDKGIKEAIKALKR